MNLRRAPSLTSDQADDDDGQPDDADQPSPCGVPHGRGRHVLLLARLTVPGAGDHVERQVGKARVEHRPAQRLQPGSGPRRLGGDAERGFAQPPQGVGGEADAEQPQRNQPVGLTREQLQGAALIRFLRALAERDEHGDPADQYVDDTPRRQARPGQELRDRAFRSPLGFADNAGDGFGVHTRLYLDSARGNVRRRVPGRRSGATRPARARSRRSRRRASSHEHRQDHLRNLYASWRPQPGRGGRVRPHPGPARAFAPLTGWFRRLTVCGPAGHARQFEPNGPWFTALAPV